MSKTIEATYDGKTLRLSESLDIPPDTKVWVTINTDKPKPLTGFLNLAKSARLEGPADWSENLDSYLYGTSSAD